jgi:hypothetical protein
MKMTVEVSSRNEGDALRRALEDPVLRTSALVTGLLLDLEDVEDRLRVLAFVSAQLRNGHQRAPGALRIHDGSNTTGE